MVTVMQHFSRFIGLSVGRILLIKAEGGCRVGVVYVERKGMFQRTCDESF